MVVEQWSGQAYSARAIDVLCNRNGQSVESASLGLVCIGTPTRTEVHAYVLLDVCPLNTPAVYVSSPPRASSYRSERPFRPQLPPYRSLRFAIGGRACRHPKTPQLIFIKVLITTSHRIGAYCVQSSFDGQQVVRHEAAANRKESPAVGWSDMPWECATASHPDSLFALRDRAPVPSSSPEDKSGRQLHRNDRWWRPLAMTLMTPPAILSRWA
ncbi:hypothetical protein EDB92DRAFT_1148769 [Lactarius akahatsu]|uniref:Uncharacterized protein n=1 Tax=Lactarius akahatsu TaxID=416441 RepID=A0AAD4L968_9AGAM|nr:hypothetical protein EDB92DRAFT_1148769 [Lactarius akahatsu]